MAFIRKLKSNPWLISGLIVLAVTIWMLTTTDEPPAPQAQSEQDGKKMPDVQVERQQAETVERYINVYGRSEPARTVTLKAETSGSIVEITADRGAYLESGADLLRIDVRDRREQLNRAKAEVERARIQYEAEQKLKGESFASEVRLAEAAAALEAAKAEQRRAELDLTRTRIIAPFDGSLQDRYVEEGDYVAAGDPIASFVDIDTLIITGSVSETERNNLIPGSLATAQLITGQQATGKLRYIAPVADEATRTFQIELEVANPDHALPAGVTAEIKLPVGETTAHRISPAILTLDSNGEIGIKTVGKGNKVEFTKVDIIKSTGEGVWITGLPEIANIITVGQGFVKPGEIVNPVIKDDTAVAAAGGAE